MTKTIHQNRLSIDISPEEHRLIKINAILHNQTIREYVLEELWDNKKDAMYDNKIL